MLKDGMPVIYANHSWSTRALTEVHVREFRVGREFGVLRPRILMRSGSRILRDYVAKKPDVAGHFGDGSLSLLYSCADLCRTQAARCLSTRVNRAPRASCSC